MTQTQVANVDPRSLKQCSCGSVYSHDEWNALTTRRLWVFPDEVLEIAECVGCNTTMSVPMTVPHV